MKAAALISFSLFVSLLCTLPVPAAEQPPASFDGARWVWFGGEDWRKAPAATRYFRFTLTLPAAPAGVFDVLGAPLPAAQTLTLSPPDRLLAYIRWQR